MPIAESTVDVVATKYDGVESFSWTAGLIRNTGTCLSLRIEEGTIFQSAHHGPFSLESNSVIHLFRHRWYNVSAHLTSEGKIVSYYCNIATPYRFDGRVARYVDLEIDVVVSADGDYSIRDLDEFGVVQSAMAPGMRLGAVKGLYQVVADLYGRKFPFEKVA
ncbi:MAG: DUF402 domain-containing protein [Chloroflexota bacterium]|nr:DUF402 domain-containing protein [Chloroflexota bacterium]